MLLHEEVPYIMPECAGVRTDGRPLCREEEIPYIHYIYIYINIDRHINKTRGDTFHS